MNKDPCVPVEFCPFKGLSLKFHTTILSCLEARTWMQHTLHCPLMRSGSYCKKRRVNRMAVSGPVTCRTGMWGERSESLLFVRLTLTVQPCQESEPSPRSSRPSMWQVTYMHGGVPSATSTTQFFLYNLFPRHWALATLLLSHSVYHPHCHSGISVPTQRQFLGLVWFGVLRQGLNV